MRRTCRRMCRRTERRVSPTLTRQITGAAGLSAAPGKADGRTAKGRHRPALWQACRDRSRAGAGQQRRRPLALLCDCGATAVVTGRDLRRGSTTSCGCRARAVTSARTKTHGMSGTPEYHVWQSMRARCSNPRAVGYEHYGQRGIRVCQAWQDSFEAFFAHVGQRPSAEHSLDRIDNNGDYEPGNVRWTTVHVQAANRRSTRWLTHEGRTQSLSAWAREIGISVQSLSSRLQRHGLERALQPGSWRTLPVQDGGAPSKSAQRPLRASSQLMELESRVGVRRPRPRACRIRRGPGSGTDEEKRMALTRAKYKRVTDLYVVGTELVLRESIAALSRTAVPQRAGSGPCALVDDQRAGVGLPRERRRELGLHSP